MTATRTRLEDELGDLRGYINALPRDLREGPYGAVYRTRLQTITELLQAEELAAYAEEVHSPALELAISQEREASDWHRIPAQLLGDLLQIWQTLFSALGQAVAGKPTSRGLIPADILRETRLDVLGFAPGSFVTRLVLQESEQTVLPKTGQIGTLAFEQFERLWAAGADHHELSILLHQLKGRTLSAYTKLLELLSNNSASLLVRMAEPRRSDVRIVRLETGKVQEILPRLGDASIVEQTEQQIIGVLNAANRRTGTFEIDLGEEGTISGRVVLPAVLDGIVIGHRYVFKLSEVVTRDPLTSSHGASWSLIDVRDVDGP